MPILTKQELDEHVSFDTLCLPGQPPLPLSTSVTLNASSLCWTLSLSHVNAVTQFSLYSTPQPAYQWLRQHTLIRSLYHTVFTPQTMKRLVCLQSISEDYLQPPTGEGQLSLPIMKLIVIPKQAGDRRQLNAPRKQLFFKSTF